MSKLPNFERIAIDQGIRQYLEELPDVDVIAKRIQRYRNTQTFLRTKEEACIAFERVFESKEGMRRKGSLWPLRASASIGNPGTDTYLYRVRHGIIREGIKGCWTLPSQKVKGNRLNRNREPVLYTSTTVGIAAGETGARDPEMKGQLYSIIVYGIVSDLKLVRIGYLPIISIEERKELEELFVQKTSLTIEQMRWIMAERIGKKEVMEKDYAEGDLYRKLVLLSNFIRDAFSIRPLDEELVKRAYYISQHITRTLFPLTEGYSGWQYPCVQMGIEDENICLLATEAKRKLALKEVLIVRARGPVEMPEFLYALTPERGKLIRADKSETIQEAFHPTNPWAPTWIQDSIEMIDENKIIWPSERKRSGGRKKHR